MYWIVAGLFAVGVLCGAFVRLPLFLAILAGAAFIATLTPPELGDVGALLSAVITVIALEVGYVTGVVLRAAVHWLRSKGDASAKARRDQSVHVPTGQKHR